MFLEGESWGPFLEKLEGWPRGAREARSPVHGAFCHPRGWITSASLAPSIFLAAGSRVWTIPSHSCQGQQPPAGLPPM